MDYEICSLLNSNIYPYAKLCQCVTVEDVQNQVTQQEVLHNVTIPTLKVVESKEKARELLLQKEYRTALSWFERAIGLNPCDSELLSNKAGTI